MYKTLVALGVVLALVFGGLYKLEIINPVPVANSVLAEKSTSTRIGGQVAVLIPADLGVTQHQLLNMAYEIAKADGHKNPELVQGILLQESRAGGMTTYKVAGNKGDEYYGVGQIKLGATREVMSTWPALWAKYKFQTRTDDELKANLILNNQFNIEVTSKYLKLLQTRYGFTGRQLLNAYQQGPGGVHGVGEDHYYALQVEAKLAEMKAKKHG
jgi:hypothetical protein